MTRTMSVATKELISRFLFRDMVVVQEHSATRLASLSNPCPGCQSQLVDSPTSFAETKISRHLRIKVSDLTPRRASYQSLDSDALPTTSGETADSYLPDGQKFFSWNRIRRNLGREPPKTPLTILDQPLYRRGIQESADSNRSKHVPHDNFLKELPSLPFPLVSLPEAQMLQQFKRQRGEEDHTESAGNFAARSRSNTISTAPSPGPPATPSPPKRNPWPLSTEDDITRPEPTHQPHGLRQMFRRRDCK
jgi:hypothetical protein